MSESTLEAPAIAHTASPPAEPTEAPKAWTLRGFMRAHPWWSIAVALVIVSIALVLYVLVAGALLALASAAARGRLVALAYTTAALALRGAPREGTMLVPYGVAIAAGSFVYALSTVVPALRLPL